MNVNELAEAVRKLDADLTPGPWTVDHCLSDYLGDIVLDYPTPHAGSPVPVASTWDCEYLPISKKQAERNAIALAKLRNLLPDIRSALLRTL